MAMAMAAELSFAEASETERRGERNAMFRLSFFNNFPSSESSHEVLLAAVSAMIFSRRGIDARLLSSVCVIFSSVHFIDYVPQHV